MISIEQIDNLLKNSGAILDQNGDKVGKAGQVFVGDDSQQPEWATVKTGLFGHSETFIPLREASVEGNDVRVPYGRDKIKEAPRTDLAGGHLEREQEAELYRYYGLEPERGSSASRNDDGGQGVQQEPVREDAGDGSYGGGYDQDLKHEDTSEERHRHRAGDDQPHSEGFGENRYDQLRGPQSEDLRRPVGTSGASDGADVPGKGADNQQNSREHRRRSGGQ